MTTADPLFELLSGSLAEERKVIDSQTKSASKQKDQPSSGQESTKYLSRLLSLSLSDLTTTEPQSLSQASHSNLLSIQALSSRSHRSTTTSSDRLATLSDLLPSLERSTIELRNAVPGLDESAVNFAATYGRTRIGRSGAGIEYDETSGTVSNVNMNEALKTRKDSQLLARQADKLQDIFELPSLLRASIAAASSSASSTSIGPSTNSTGGSASQQPSSSTTAASTTTNYTQALDLFTHIRRLQILYPDSHLIRSLQREAELAMHDMTTSLLLSLRSQNIRLAAAIRTIGWLRRVIPQLSSSATSHPLYTATTTTVPRPISSSTIADSKQQQLQTSETQDEDLFGPLFLVSRLATFLSITTEALSPLRDLADQETEKRVASTAPTMPANQPGSRRASGTPATTALSGQQTERYLKRYIEVFREHSFATLQMYRNIFPRQTFPSENEDSEKDADPLRLPSAIASFPLHLVSLLMETLQTYLPNITDPAARESLLMQVLYAANSLGRLGADFTMMIALLDLPESGTRPMPEDDASEQGMKNSEPEWARVIKKHRIQAARLDALTANHNT